MHPSELFGHYVKKSSIRSSPQEYAFLKLKAKKVSQILGQMFPNFAKLSFEANCDAMKDKNIPSFSSLEFDSKPTPFDCFQPITFTPILFKTLLILTKATSLATPFYWWLQPRNQMVELLKIQKNIKYWMANLFFLTLALELISSKKV